MAGIVQEPMTTGEKKFHKYLIKVRQAAESYTWPTQTAEDLLKKIKDVVDPSYRCVRMGPFGWLFLQPCKQRLDNLETAIVDLRRSGAECVNLLEGLNVGGEEQQGVEEFLNMTEKTPRRREVAENFEKKHANLCSEINKLCLKNAKLEILPQVVSLGTVACIVYPLVSACATAGATALVLKKENLGLHWFLAGAGVTCIASWMSVLWFRRTAQGIEKLPGLIDDLDEHLTSKFKPLCIQMNQD